MWIMRFLWGEHADFITLLRKALIVVPLTLLLELCFGVQGMFLAEPISNAIGDRTERNKRRAFERRGAKHLSAFLGETCMPLRLCAKIESLRQRMEVPL